MDTKKDLIMAEVKNFLMIILGTLIIAIGINMFLVHANLLSGGLSGVALIIQYVTKFPAGYSIFILNIPLFLLSCKKTTKKFTIYSLMGTGTLSFFLIITSSIKNVLAIKDPLILGIYGGILTGAGIGLVFSNYGSTGGLDILAVVIKQKYENFEIGTISFIVNVIIIAVGATIFGITSALYTLISMYLTSAVMDKVIKGFNRQKLILIISDNEDLVCTKLMENLNRGVTFLYGEGAYTKKNKKIVYCVVALQQLPLLKHVVRETDPEAFISILDVAEVEGKGFNKGLV